MGGFLSCTNNITNINSINPVLGKQKTSHTILDQLHGVNLNGPVDYTKHHKMGGTSPSKSTQTGKTDTFNTMHLSSEPFPCAGCGKLCRNYAEISAHKRVCKEFKAPPSAAKKSSFSFRSS